MRFIYTILLACLCCMSQTVFSQKNKPTCELVGHVMDTEGEHLSFISVQLKGTSIGAMSDASGHFLITQIPQGTYTVVARSLGYRSFEKEITLVPGKTNEVEIYMAEDAVELNTVVVTANRYEVPRKEVSSIVSVISPLTFENTNSNALSEGLCYMPGLRVENNCQNCGYQQVRINGLDGQYSRILIDGRPIVSSLTGVYGLEQIPAGMVDRVEVLRGGGSVLYGSGAIAGTINIITKEPLKNSATLSHNLTMVGNSAAENSSNINASLVSNDRNAGLFLFSNIKNRNSYDHDGDGYSELPMLKGTTSGFRGFYKTSALSKLTLEYHNISEHRRGGNLLDKPAHEANIAEQLDHYINGGGMNWDLFSADYKHKLSIYASTQHTDRKSFYGGINSDNESYGGYGRTTDLTADGGLQYAYTFDRLWFMPATLIAGAEYNYDKLEDVTVAYDRDVQQTVKIGSAFVQNEWSNKQFSILLGARIDKHNMIKNAVFSPRMNFRYSPIEDIGIRASYSTGFLAPQAFSEDLHTDAAQGTLVLIQLAPDLKPEYSRSTGLSLDLYHTFGTVQTNLLIEAFYTTLSDVFLNHPIGENDKGYIIKEKRNAHGAVVKGVNLEAKAAFNKNYQVQGGYTFQSSRYKDPVAWAMDDFVEDMLRSPGQYGYFMATLKPLKAFQLALSGTYTGSMKVEHYITDSPVIKETPDFFDANFKLSYTFKLKGNANLEVNTGMQNVFNAYQKDFDKGAERDAAYIYGPITPRSWFAGLKISM